MNASDQLHKIRLYLDSLTSPSNVISALSPFVGGPAAAMYHGAQDMGSQGDILKNHVGAFNTPPTAPAPASPPTAPPAMGQGYNMFGPATQASPLMPTNNTPSPLDNAQWPSGPQGAPSAAQASAPAPAVPMPQARPAQAPTSAPEMNFWQRNTAMMRDPTTGDFLDPMAAQQANAAGPDVIQKFMNYFHQKGLS